MADVRKALVLDGLVHNVYAVDQSVIDAKLDPVKPHLIDCDDAVRPGWLHRDGAFIDPASLVPLPTSRQKRREEYFDALRVEPGDDQLVVLGDQVDKIIAQIEAMRAELGAKRTADFTDLLAKIVAIKAKFPKPPG